VEEVEEVEEVEVDEERGNEDDASLIVLKECSLNIL